ncbi:MAG: efflux RND transporter periplasmic adaptor subunit [Nitrosomonadales bacterium]|nr:efflux RND transporter periplasmic adaptor subunit [Nitrosomonadales bacterium]
MHKNKKPFLLCLALLASCEKPPAPPEPLRPVKTMQVVMEPNEASFSLPGEVRARYETPLAFRVGGKITECKVNLGDIVHRGQILAKLEPADYQLATQSGAAGVAEARSALTLAEADLIRYRSLREKGFVSAAMLDQKQAAADAARARVEALQSAHAEQNRQLDYTTLPAESDGVVTGYDCNVGQVVNVGQPILKLAQAGEKEILINLPEAELQHARSAANFSVSLNALPGKLYQGTLRELSAAADPATRTYAARLAVKNADASMQLGMSATVDLHPVGNQVMRLPLSAVVSRDSKPSVWKVDNTGVVHGVAIAIAGIEGNAVRIASGLNSGDVVVTAGVNLLRDGEKVKLP